jgi:hypothetical protein
MISWWKNVEWQETSKASMTVLYKNYVKNQLVKSSAFKHFEMAKSLRMKSSDKSYISPLYVCIMSDNFRMT